MLLIALAILGLGGADGPQNHQVIQPNPNGAPRTSARFSDNHGRRAVDDWRRERRAREEAIRLDQAQSRRLALADRLDVLISAGDCDEARRQASSSGWRDIAAEVDRVCSAAEP